MSLLDREDVPAAKSRASTRPTESPRVTASSAAPAPTTPPPTPSTWSSASVSAASAADLPSGLSRAVSAPPAITRRTLVHPPWPPARPGLRRAGERGADHDRVGAAGERLGYVAAAAHAAVGDHVHVTAARLVQVVAPR